MFIQMALTESKSPPRAKPGSQDFLILSARAAECAKNAMSSAKQLVEEEEIRKRSPLKEEAKRELKFSVDRNKRGPNIAVKDMPMIAGKTDTSASAY